MSAHLCMPADAIESRMMATNCNAVFSHSCRQNDPSKLILGPLSNWGLLYCLVLRSIEAARTIHMGFLLNIQNSWADAPIRFRPQYGTGLRWSSLSWNAGHLQWPSSNANLVHAQADPVCDNTGLCKGYGCASRGKGVTLDRCHGVVHVEGIARSCWGAANRETSSQRRRRPTLPTCAAP